MASKICDGLFIGDLDTSQDPEFLELNKISNLVNFAGREIPNVWAGHGLVYLTFLWEDRADFRLFSSNDGTDGDEEGGVGGGVTTTLPRPLGELVEFIDTSLRHGISVLLFSTRGTGRCGVAACAYLMCKYQWGFEKAFDLVMSKKPDVAPNKGFVQQLFGLDKTLLLMRNWLGASPSSSDAKGSSMVNVDEMQLTMQPHELMRWRDWDPAYLLQEQSQLDTQIALLDAEIEKNGYSARRKASWMDLERRLDAVTDELLIVNSYLNARHDTSPIAPLPLKEKHRGIRWPKQQLAYVQDPNAPPSVPVDPSYVAERGILKHGSRVAKTVSSVDLSSQSKSTSKQAANSGVGHRGGGGGGGGGAGNYDLYGFVGMESGSKASAPSSSSSTSSSSSSRPPNSSAASSSSSSSVSLTAEERLKQMVRNMTANTYAESKGGDSGGTVRNRQSLASNDGSRYGEAGAKSGGERDRDKERQDAKDSRYAAAPASRPPSLYELATMPLASSASRPIKSSYGGSRGGEDDPLAAFSLMQMQSGPIRASAGLEITGSNGRGKDRPTSANVNRSSPSKGSWTDGGSSGGSRPNSSSAESGARIYRKGSPARPRSASDRGGIHRPSSSGGGSSGASVASQNSQNSQASYGRSNVMQPTAASSRYERRGSGSSFASMNSIEQPTKRHGSPMPSPRDLPQQRASTPTRQGWR